MSVGWVSYGGNKVDQAEISPPPCETLLLMGEEELMQESKGDSVSSIFLLHPNPQKAVLPTVPKRQALKIPLLVGVWTEPKEHMKRGINE